MVGLGKFLYFAFQLTNSLLCTHLHLQQRLHFTVVRMHLLLKLMVLLVGLLKIALMLV